MCGIVAEDVPLEGLTEQGDVDTRPAEIHHRQACKGLGQKLQQQVLEHGDFGIYGFFGTYLVREQTYFSADKVFAVFIPSG